MHDVGRWGGHGSVHLALNPKLKSLIGMEHPHRTKSQNESDKS